MVALPHQRSAKQSPKDRRGSKKLDGVTSRQLKLIVLAAVSFAAIAALGANWGMLFPVPAEDVIEIAWTHQCRCVDGWMDSLRANGFVVRDYELESLRARRQLWHVPDAAQGCHPTAYMGYILDGHVPPVLIRRLAREHPQGIALIEVKPKLATDKAESSSAGHFELLHLDGSRAPWPAAAGSDPSQHS